MYSQRGCISARKLETSDDVAKLSFTRRVKGPFSLPAAAAVAAVAVVEADEPLFVGKHMVDMWR